METNDKLHNLRHTLAHLLASAVGKIYKFDKIKLTLGPSIENGFYYDIDFGNEKISDSDLKKIEDTMRKELPKWTAWEQKELNKEEALNFFKNEYKIELINEIADRGEKITTYTCGGFTDLCRGGHLDHPSQNIDPLSFKLDRVAGAYWRGNEKNKMLTRIYGLAFETKEDLDTYINQREEAKKRDHKKLGKELGLFVISELVGKGLPMYLPKGNIIKTELENFIRKEKENLGYSFVTIPHIARKELYIRSGHMGKYDAMMPIMTDENGEEFVMKAMNCPHHFEIYNAEPHSYRDLPLRIAENTTVYRNEKSGELAGLLRVKNLTQDDTHHFIRNDQIESEIEMIFGLMQKVYNIFGFKDYKVEISIRDPKNKEKYFGSDDVWEKAENILVNSAKKMNLKYSIEEGEAAFYGPKIDIKIKDSIGREWQLATIQLDFNQPNNFEMDYVGEDGKKHRVVVLHVAIFGSFERFIGILIEHYAGAFPLWLSPVQVKIIPVRENHNEYAKQIYDLLKENNIRAELANENGNLGGKVRDAKNNKIPYWIVIGDKEIEADKITLESRDKGQLNQISKEELIAKLLKEIKSKK
ncbi:threonine--tRNA ligase [Candidatus Nomurabacteria bacterium CG_4_10_14_0_2_um_filter_30_12]|uniref:Threonine--tRNA ligase n=2 Tax=Candidatus Nomuraibacteriota TaxID=1752729 RepID=A0A1J4UXS8_9BACT|nr:MAG: threonine--tRNA ligase [Candidatus Nomurabacteria bacterium CG1_02_31_12]PIZ87261.1 MAG: threonine--tRNA ligase [Candidatus Nomurabacteria bacterium CG_4_10_14_0_2_um_filter_30_12]